MNGGLYGVFVKGGGAVVELQLPQLGSELSTMTYGFNVEQVLQGSTIL